MQDAKAITLPDVQPGMLVLSRCTGEKIVIGENVVVTVTSARNGRVRLGVQTAGSINIRRAEVPPLPTINAAEGGAA